MLLAVDNTFMTPFFQRPLELGADVVAHSLTKYLNGHSDVVGGALIFKDAALRERVAFLQNAVGAVPSPMDCFLVLRGTKTLHVRMERHEENARALAAWLDGAPAGREGQLPGPRVAPAARAREASRCAGFGGMMSFVLQGRPRRGAAVPRRRASCSRSPSRSAASSR